jgi:hypothetical protein
MNKFFKETELLDGYNEEEYEVVPGRSSAVDESFIGCRNATFTWNPEPSATGTDTPSSQFKLTIPDELQFAKGGINLIVGPT